MAVIIFISVIVAVTIQQFDKDHDELPDLSKVSVLDLCKFDLIKPPYTDLCPDQLPDLSQVSVLDDIWLN